MKKKIATAFSVLLLSCSVANASSINGDFEGNPIVKVTSNGQDLKFDDVPAINYKGRTMVPIYLLNQLGAETKWDENTYSVNVKLDSKIDVATQKNADKENQAILDTYEWLSDTNQAMFNFIVTLNQYADLDNPENYSQIIKLDSQDITQLNTDSQAFALQVYNTTHSDNHINDILASQTKTITQISQTTDLFYAWINSKKDPKMFALFNSNIHQSLLTAQQNISVTNKFKHDLFIKDAQ
jgi:hypothetical protein